MGIIINHDIRIPFLKNHDIPMGFRKAKLTFHIQHTPAESTLFSPQWKRWKK